MERGTLKLKLYIIDTKSENRKRFSIFDELGNERYTVSLEYTPLTTKIDVYDIYMKKLAKIRKRDVITFNTFTISCKSPSHAKNKLRIISNLLNFKDCFYMCGINWLIRGDIISKNFELIDVDSSIVMRHEKKEKQSKTVYEINISDDKNEILCVCISLCIDILNTNAVKNMVRPIKATD